jgi:DNA-binding NarL/FixJ family response regulator
LFAQRVRIVINAERRPPGRYVLLRTCAVARDAAARPASGAYRFGTRRETSGVAHVEERGRLQRLLATVAAAERAMSPEERERVLWPGLAELVDFDEPGVLALVRPYLTGPQPAGAARLSARERQVLALVAEGRTDRAIGHQLGVSVRTVHKHLEHAYAKLGVNDRTSAALRFVNGTP